MSLRGYEEEQKFITVVVELETEEVRYYTFAEPVTAVRFLLDLPFSEERPRPTRGKILWGGVLDNFSY